MKVTGAELAMERFGCAGRDKSVLYDLALVYGDEFVN